MLAAGRSLVIVAIAFAAIQAAPGSRRVDRTSIRPRDAAIPSADGNGQDQDLVEDPGLRRGQEVRGAAEEGEIDEEQRDDDPDEGPHVTITFPS